MSTNSGIILQTKDGSFRQIYCHFDGYPHNMVPKLETYNTYEKVEQLIALGHLSYLGDTLDDTVAYHRDRGEELSIRYCSTEKELYTYEYNYMFRDGQWYMNSCSSCKWVLLGKKR